MAEIPPPHPDLFANLRQLFVDAIDLSVISLMGVVGAVLAIPGLQRRISYGGAALIFGILLGVAARWSGLPAGLDIIAVLLGVVTGPVTVAKMQGKTLSEAIEEFSKARRTMSGRGNSEGGSDDAV
jgi:hypothetical protein